jgi:acyl dehydratase
MPKPVFIGDTMHADTTVTAVRDSGSRPEAGLVTFTHRLLNQRNEVVCQCLRTAFIRRKPT